jgi:lipooligosaccharide transport system permease protein
MVKTFSRPEHAAGRGGPAGRRSSLNSLRLTFLSCLFFVDRRSGRRGFAAGRLAIPVAVLTGLAFTAPIMASPPPSARGRFNVIFRFGITPLFLFSGTFFPIEKLPLFLQPLAWITPLYHGVALARSLSLGRIEPIEDLVHLGFLAAVVTAGVVAGRLAYRRRLSV